VVYDEGLRSYKAIAFISSNPKGLSQNKIRYLKLGANLASTVLAKQKPLRNFYKNLGEKLWTN
jgi:hypothetical protein